MTDRDEIIGIVNGIGLGHDGVKLGYILEVLLDIRDLLNNPPKEPHELFK